MTTSLDIRVLGPLEVEDGGRPIDLGPPKQRAVFAVLLLNANRLVPTERLIDEVWGETPPRTAAHSVQIYVSELRKALDGTPASIETRPPGYLLSAPPLAVDALRFEEVVKSALAAPKSDGTLDKLQAAMQMWNGDPLADFAYDDFAQDRIRRLHSLHERAAERLAEATLQAGRPAEALAWLDEIGSESQSDRARSLRVLAIYRSGRQLDALRQIDRHRRELAEVGLTLSDDLLELEDMVLNRDARLDAPPWGDRGPNPYKGLSPFTEDDAGRMFGRERLIEDLVERLELGSRLIAVVGPSGCGKSSIIRAGVATALMSRPSTAGWEVRLMTPGEAPMERLETVVQDTNRGPRLIIVDQFEEAFVLAHDDRQDDFLLALEELAGDGRTRILLAMRADHLDGPLTSPRFADLFAAGMHPVTPMSADDLRRAIAMPARRAGVEVEPVLVERIVADMEHEPAALPLMQYALTELFDGAVGYRLTLDAYDDLGGIKGALTMRADGLYDSLTVADRGRLRRLLLSLVEAKGIEIRRRAISAADLVHSGGEGTEHLLDQLTRHRLVSRDRDPVSGEAIVQLTHEALIDEWQRLRGWVAAHQTDLNRRESLTLHAQEWEEGGRDPIYLLGGRALAVYQEWARTSAVPIGEGETAYLEACRHRHDELEAEKAARREAARRQRRNARLRLVAIAGLIAALAATATYFLGPSISRFFNPPPDVVIVTEASGLAWDGSFNEAANVGFISGIDATGMEGLALAPAYSQRLFDVDDQAGQGVGLIMLSGAPHLTSEVVEDHPDTKFVEWDIYPDPPLPNVTYFNFKEHEGAFLVGAAAALKSETGVIGFIGGIRWDVIERFRAGYEAGSRAMNPEVVILEEYLSDWYDLSGFTAPSRAKTVAVEMYQAGADVIFHAAGASGIGLFDAADEQSKALGRHLWAIGVDSDQYHAIDGSEATGPWDPPSLREHILTSMLKRIDIVVETAMREYAAGRLEPGVRVLGLAEGGVDYSRSGGFVADIVPQLEALRMDIISGRIIVPER